MSAICCPHCEAENIVGAAFCEQCGKALPSASPAGPRVVSGEEMATTAVGQEVQANQLHKTAVRGSTALIAIAILHAIGGVLFYFQLQEDAPAEANTALTLNLVLGVIYLGLGIWARHSPLPAALVGLVLFLSVMILEAAVNPASLVQGVIVKIIVIVILIKAIQAGLKNKRLKEQSAGGPTAS